MPASAVTKVQINVSAIGRFFTTEPAAQAGLEAAARNLEAAASAATPRGKSTGQFRQRGGPNGYVVGPFGEPYKHGFAKVSYHTRKFRGGYRVYTRDYWANVIEFGSVNNPVYAPMRRALRAVSGGKRVIYAAKVTSSQAIAGEHTGGVF